MNKRIFFIISVIVILIGGISLYKKISTINGDQRKICIYSASSPGAKNDMHLIAQALQLQDIKKSQIINNSNRGCENAPLKIFLEQDKLDEHLKNNNDESLKIGIHLRNPVDEEDSRTIGLVEENNIQQLLEFIGNIIKTPINCLVIYDDQYPFSKDLIAQYQEIAKIKKINLQPLSLSIKQNIATILKTASSNINSVILLPSPLILSDFELILEHFKLKKIPVFANHAGLIRAGALGGYDFDMQEVAHDIAEICGSFLLGSIKNDAFEEVYPQLHLNMDTIRHLGIQLESEDFLDEAVTMGGSDL